MQLILFRKVKKNISLLIENLVLLNSCYFKYMETSEPNENQNHSNEQVTTHQSLMKYNHKKHHISKSAVLRIVCFTQTSDYT